MKESFSFEAGPSVEAIAVNPNVETIKLYTERLGTILDKKGLQGIENFF